MTTPKEPTRVMKLAKTLEPTSEIMADVLFKPDLHRLGFIEEATEQEIMNELMLFQCDPVFAMREGGPLTESITRFILGSPAYAKCEASAAMRGGKIRPIVDTRTHMLFPGMYPAIPGWHCDFVPRAFGQPDLTKLKNRVVKAQRYFTVVVSSHPDGVSNPCYLKESITADFSNEFPVWGQLHFQINALMDEHPIPMHVQADREIMMFNTSTIHRASIAHNKGWRFFYRMAVVDATAKNDIRKQTQVYADPNIGW